MSDESVNHPCSRARAGRLVWTAFQVPASKRITSRRSCRWHRRPSRALPGGPYSAGRFDSFCLFGDVAENVRRLFLVACKPTRRPRLRRARWSHATLRREHPARGARPAAPLSRTPVASRPRRFLPALPRACRGPAVSRHGTLALGVSWFTRRSPHCPVELRSDCRAQPHGERRNGTQPASPHAYHSSNIGYATRRLPVPQTLVRPSRYFFPVRTTRMSSSWRCTSSLA